MTEDIVKRTLLDVRDVQQQTIVSINVFEYITVIINYCAALTVLEANPQLTTDPHPILLNVTDNTSAKNWTTHGCKSSRIGRLLSKFFCYILMDSPLGINAKWIDTKENELADEISRFKKQHITPRTSYHPSVHYNYDYTSLKQRYPSLNHCRFFRMSPELDSMIWGIVSSESLPPLKEVQRMKRSGLGSLTT